MIFKLWLQIIFIFVIAVGPLFVLEYLQHEEALEITLNSGPLPVVTEAIPQVLTLFKKFSVINPNDTHDYFFQFQKWNEINKSIQEWENIKPAIKNRVQNTSIRNSILLIFLALILSYVVARSITLQFQKLLSEREKQSQRDAELKALTQWQTTARNLVHELRGPLTPIKLITSSIASDENLFSDDEVTKEGILLALEKIQQMELMIQKFMTFAKLPEAKLEQKSLNQILKPFIEHYSNSFSDNLHFDSIIDLGKSSEKLGDLLLNLDEGLLHNAFYALSKNVIEALEHNDKSVISFQIILEDQLIALIFKNSGTYIPASIESKLFQIGTSSKLSDKYNFGIGLAMAKKVMLEHHGDLILSQNSKTEGVSFKFLFPRKIL